jgi:hypothetical protein
MDALHGRHGEGEKGCEPVEGLWYWAPAMFAGGQRWEAASDVEQLEGMLHTPGMGTEDERGYP